MLRGSSRGLSRATCRLAQGGGVSAQGSTLAVVGARLVQQGALPGER